jgi:phage shock protein A
MIDKNVDPDEKKKPEEPRILAEPLPKILKDMDENVKKATEAAIKAAIEEATAQINEARQSIEENRRKAEEALSKASEALPAELVKRVIGSWQLMSILILFFLAAVLAATAISLGLSLIAR